MGLEIMLIIAFDCEELHAMYKCHQGKGTVGHVLHSHKKAGIRLRRRPGGRVGHRDPEGGDCRVGGGEHLREVWHTLLLECEGNVG